MESGCTYKHWVLNNTGLAEGDAESVRSFRFLFRDFLKDKIVKWLKILWRKIVFFLHLVALEVD